jgi:acetyl-CoA acetyltransferase
LAERSGLDPAVVEDVFWGCVSQVGEQTFNIGRNAPLAAGWPETVPGTTIDRQCGSSQQAVAFAAATVISGQADVIVAGGVESMSRVPMGSTYGVEGTGMPMGPRFLERYDGTLVFISHDVHFIRKLATKVLHVNAGTITAYSGSYDYFVEKTGGLEDDRAALIAA